ncbi:FAD-dependent oxidoreductase [Aeromicrobium sp.]|uniref:NAD(P)/FAD-dependent oxidoreductase n=1 Tax=Aeromicrobium sp. TaxID=1871063 RepID=UPI0019B3E096|nr:FAD-dependent oxidoreductase [Aeromicrobium sp.]MBC7631649.1 FAD-dependent oxidoreductase [Aeromicrobium sp.]
MAQVIVVGAGISGLACAKVVADAGHEVNVLDRGFRPGGRMAVHQYDNRPIDIGASYFTVSDPMFEATTDDWERRGLARPWTDTLSVWSPDGTRTKSGPTRWAAAAGLESLVADLGSTLDIHSSVTVEQVTLVDGRAAVDGQTADAVVLAMPDPQARRLLTPELGSVADRLDAEFDPVLALTTIWPMVLWAAFDGIFVNDHDTLSWVADDGRRRGDDAPVLVAHSTPDFARPRLDDLQDATSKMLEALVGVVGIEPAAEVLRADMHRWTFARPSATRDAPFLLDDRGVGVCGDGWSTKPSVEAAFLSGTHLGEALVQRL